MKMEDWWNENGMEKPEYSEENLSQWHPIQQKSFMHWPKTEPVPPWLEGSDQQPETWYDPKAPQISKMLQPNTYFK